ncbi:MAG: glycosyltransferase family 9 protein [Phycisphaerales bacterium]|jgi:heptosyltransferase-2|nr:glycosyltransferase family 9 protein [Phycisphaerales bacterium]
MDEARAIAAQDGAAEGATGPARTGTRVLVVMPSWIGDAIMATPTLRLIRRSMPDAHVGLLVRPGVDEVLRGLDSFDEMHVDRPSGMMGPKRVGQKLRGFRYDVALLLTNSFSTALTAMMAQIPRRVGYDRDARGLLLTRRVRAETRAHVPGVQGRWKPVPAAQYYWSLTREMLREESAGGAGDVPEDMPGDAYLELRTTPGDERLADEMLSSAGLEPRGAFALINPGGNNPAKRWPADRFAAVADHLATEHGLVALVNGSPGEAEVVEEVVRLADVRTVALHRLGGTLGSLKALVRRSRIMVTNDTGPRHVAAAMGVPVVTLFGPTDHRWTTIPTRPGAGERVLLADPSLPEDMVADDHPERCRVDRIRLTDVVAACDELLGPRG